MAGATLYSDGKQYITDNRVWTEDEWNSPEGKAYREQVSKTHADLWAKDEKRQAQAKEERARVSAKIRAAFQSREHETGHER